MGLDTPAHNQEDPVDNLTHKQALREARAAAAKASRLAGYAENAAHTDDPNRRHQVPQFAASGALWADVSRSYTALAAVLPETEPETEPADV